MLDFPTWKRSAWGHGVLSIVGHQLHDALAAMRITPTGCLANGSALTQGPWNLAGGDGWENPQITDFRKVVEVKSGLFQI